MGRKAIAAIIAIALSALAAEQNGGPAEAAAINVACNTPALISAIETANNETTNPGPDTLDLAPGCTYTLTSAYTSAIGLPLITTDITINANAATIVRQAGAPQFKLIHVDHTGDLTLNNVILTGGRASDAPAGLPGDHGGAMTVFGALTLVDSVVSGNSAGNGGPHPSGAGGAGGNGGGIAVRFNGVVTILRSAITNNQAGNGGNGASFSAGGKGGDGGGIYFEQGNGAITNSTISGNSTGQGGTAGSFIAADGRGGGIRNNNSSNTSVLLEITNSTIAENTAEDGSTGHPLGGGGFSGGFSVFVENSLLSNTSGGNCALAPAGVDNIATDASCGGAFTQKTPAEINLQPLANNGGPTQTMALRHPSAAIDTADDTICGNAPVNYQDQRGVGRPHDGDGDGIAFCDIGAYEAPTLQGGPTLTVNTTASDNDGACHALPFGDCTLREAINAANGDGAASTVVLGNGQTYTLNVVDNNFNGLPLINTDITIEGNGSTIARDAAAPQFRFFQVMGTGILRLEQATLTGGYSPNNASLGGGAMRIEAGGAAQISDSTISGNRSGNGSGSNGSGKPGGGIYAVDATLTLTDSTVSGNLTGNGAGSGAGGHGGGIYAQGTGSLTINRSTISGNRAGDGGDGGFLSSGSGGSGAGIFIEANITASIANTTIANNTAGDRGGAPGSGGSGGGIRNLSANLTLTNVTLAGNRVGSGGSANTGGNISTTAAALASNVIASAPALGTNCAGVAFGAGSTANLASDASCTPGFTQQTAGQINLGALTDNGGPTLTMALVRPSAAIDAGDNATCAAAPVNNLDQRGISRPVDGDAIAGAVCDIGAFEAPVPDDDGDGVPNGADNCPAWPNPSQALPTFTTPVANDSDCDGFSDAREAYLGTHATRTCAFTTLINDETTLPAGWPLDMNDNRIVNTIDAGFFVGKLGLDNTEGGWTPRLDLNQSPNGIINTIDVGLYVGRLGDTCSPTGT